MHHPPARIQSETTSWIASLAAVTLTEAVEACRWAWHAPPIQSNCYAYLPIIGRVTVAVHHPRSYYVMYLLAPPTRLRNQDDKQPSQSLGVAGFALRKSAPTRAAVAAQANPRRPSNVQAAVQRVNASGCHAGLGAARAVRETAGYPATLRAGGRTTGYRVARCVATAAACLK